MYLTAGKAPGGGQHVGEPHWGERGGCGEDTGFASPPT